MERFCPDDRDTLPKLNRREFLQRLATATGAVATASLLDEVPALAAPRKRLRVIIVGAGLAGLCAAYELEKRGHDVVILEADKSHAGGRVRTVRFGDGLYGELGAMRIPHSHEVTLRYVRQFGLGLRPFVQFNPHAYVFEDGRRQRLGHAPNEERLHALGMERRSGIFGGEFSEIIGGMDRLPNAFVARLREKPRMGSAVIRLEQDESRRRVAAVYRARGTGQETLKRVDGDFLLCTVPLPVLRRIEVRPAFSAAKQRAIRALPYLAADKVLAVTARRFWETDDGIYGGASYSDLASGATYYPSDNARARNRRVSRRPGVLLASYTIGEAAQRLGMLPKVERTALVMKELKHLHPQLGRDGLVRQTATWNWSNHEWSGGAFAAPSTRDTVHRELIEPEGRIYFAGEHTAAVHSWMQGAMESALRAVGEIIRASSR